MLVLHIYSGNLYGGIETFLSTLAQVPDSRMSSDYALCFSGRLADELRSQDRVVHQLGEVRARFPWTVAAARSKLRQVLKNTRYDVAVCHSLWSQALFSSVVRGAGVPQVFWLHDSLNRGWMYFAAGMNPPDLAVFNSAFTGRALPQLYRRPSALVRYPVMEKAAESSSRASVRQEFGTAPDTTVIIQVSRMEPWKGHRLHLEALALLPRTMPWEAWFAGGAQRQSESIYLSELQQIAEQRGIADRVRFLGQRSDVDRLLAAADIHCQPNTGPEPFGITFIEALLHKLPVVTTALGGALEIVTPECGRLVRPDDARDLASALRELIEDRGLRERLGNAGPERARQLCDARGRIADIADLFSAVVWNKTFTGCESPI